MTLRVLITRPAADARPIADAFAAHGIDTLVAPMMRVEMLPGPALDLAGVQAVLATSANGARALAARTGRRDVPVYAVGEATAHTARDLGFRAVDSADGDVRALAERVIGRCRPEDGELLHGAAATVAGDLGGTLSAAGFRYRREILYEARPVADLPEAVRTALADGLVAGVALFSPRTARLFVARAEGAALSAALAAVDALCLSPAVAEAAANVTWRHTVVAPQPTGAALVAAVDAAWSGAASPER